jgi:cell division septal protein FtsQ
LKEQIITPRGNGRSGLAGNRGRSGGVTQRPSRRAGSSQGNGGLRTVLAYLPFVGKLLLAIVTGVLIFAGYRAAASASFFEARRLDISGTSRSSVEEVKTVVNRAATATGVWRADLSAISAEVEKLPWVRRAFVSRVLPDGLRVRVIERVPLAVVRNSAGRFIWVDEDAVSLSQMLPTDQMPDFFIRGWDEAGTSEARLENRERIQKYLEMSREWSALGLSQRVSEINLGDRHDIRALLTGNDAEIEVRLGERNLGKRLQMALKVLDEQRSTALGPYISYLVASQDGKITVGHRPNVSTAQLDNAASAPGETTSVSSSPRTNTTTTAASRNDAKKRVKRNEQPGAVKKRETEQRTKPAGDAKKEVRPRRVV